MIDAGADVFVGHGPHRLLGAEVYRDRPIFYSVGNLILQSDTSPFVPAHAYERFGLGPEATPSDFHDARTENDTKGPPASPTNWQSLVPVCEFRDGGLAKVELYPVELGFGRPRSQRGRPVLAGDRVAAEIVRRFEGLSSESGISVERREGTYQLRWDGDAATPPSTHAATGRPVAGPR